MFRPLIFPALHCPSIQVLSSTGLWLFVSPKGCCWCQLSWSIKTDLRYSHLCHWSLNHACKLEIKAKFARGEWELPPHALYTQIFVIFFFFSASNNYTFMNDYVWISGCRNGCCFPLNFELCCMNTLYGITSFQHYLRHICWPLLALAAQGKLDPGCPQKMCGEKYLHLQKNFMIFTET